MAGDGAPGIEPSTFAFILGLVALVWVLTVAILAVAAFTRRGRRRFRCPWLRRDVEVEGNEWMGRLLDVRQCSGLGPATDFELCGKGCLDSDQLIVDRAAPGSRPA